MGQVSPQNPVKGQDSWRKRWVIKGEKDNKVEGSKKLRKELERESEKIFHKCCRGQFFVHSHVPFVRGVTLVSPDLFWRVQPGTRHWAA